MSQKNYIIGFEGKEPPIPFSTQHECHKCKKPVWISPVSEKIIKGKKAIITCFSCMRHSKKDNFQITKEQVIEMLEVMALRNNQEVKG